MGSFVAFLHVCARSSMTFVCFFDMSPLNYEQREKHKAVLLLHHVNISLLLLRACLCAHAQVSPFWTRAPYVKGHFNCEKDKLKNDQGSGDEEIKRGKINESRLKIVTCYLSLRSQFALFTVTLHDRNFPASPSPHALWLTFIESIEWPLRISQSAHPALIRRSVLTQWDVSDQKSGSVNLHDLGNLRGLEIKWNQAEQKLTFMAVVELNKGSIYKSSSRLSH